MIHNIIIYEVVPAVIYDIVLAVTFLRGNLQRSSGRNIHKGVIYDVVPAVTFIRA